MAFVRYGPERPKGGKVDSNSASRGDMKLIDLIVYMLDAGMRDDRWMYRVGSSDVSNVEEAEPRICFFAHL